VRTLKSEQVRVLLSTMPARVRDPAGDHPLILLRV
jgi:hypothetical protein